TVVLDADTDKILYVAAGRKEKSLRPFWELLGEEGRKRIKAVGIDMGGPFIKAVKDFLPHAAIVFDHFHVSKMINTEINSIRIDLLKGSNEFLKKKLNKAKYLLMKNPSSLKPSSEEKLREILELGTPLTAAIEIREALRLVWDAHNKRTARRWLDKNIALARETDNPRLIALAKSLEKFKEGILNYHNHKITSAKIEGINNRIKTLKRRGYGYRNFGFFSLLIFDSKADVIKPVKPNKKSKNGSKASDLKKASNKTPTRTPRMAVYSQLSNDKARSTTDDNDNTATFQDQSNRPTLDVNITVVHQENQTKSAEEPDRIATF
ncbi:MAG: ISL3 family transposase, partial [Deltaproteobacteria bacterium]|nr:ISL3 family transposase [Deltaproteobacteria bacterium]